MQHFFISDTHFCESRPEHIRAFIDFCEDTPKPGDTLILLGDIFEVWVGDDVKSDVGIRIEKTLLKLSLSGIELYFMHGNRDFLISDTFLKRTHCQLLPDPSIWTLPSGEKCILTHGDLLCTHDKNYRWFRRITRNPIVQSLFLMLPLTRRIKIADSMRRASASSQKNKSYELLDVSEALVDQLFQCFSPLRLLIMGHTHRPALHNNTLGKRAVLGDWNDYIWFAISSPDSDLKLYKKSLTSNHSSLVYSA